MTKSDTETIIEAGDAASGVRAWRRSAIIDNGAAFVPAALMGDETAVTLCAGFDGVPVKSYRGHVFVPLPWAMEEAHGDDLTTLESIKNRLTREGFVTTKETL